jgi:hypothetical protein
MNLLSLIRRLEIRTGRVFKLSFLPFMHTGGGKWKILNAQLYDYRPGRVLTAPEVEASRIYEQSAHEGNKVVSHAYRPPYLPGTVLPTDAF